MSVAVAVAVIALGIAHRATVDAGGDTLAGADREWLGLAVLGVVGIWIAGTVSLFGALPVRPPIGRTFAVQVAASFLNHLLPAGVGSILVNLRFLQRHGLPRAAAAGSLGLNSLATGLTHLALLIVALPLAPATFGHVPRPTYAPLVRDAPVVGLVLVAVAILVLLAAAHSRPRRWLAARAARWRSACSRAAGELKRLRAVLSHPGRAAALWLSSLTLPLFHAITLYAVLHSIGVSVPLGTVLVIYLAVSTLVTFVPSPGGIGGLDIALVAGLATIGTSSTAAVGAVLGYRMITVWLPLLPAAGMFALLLRRRII